MGFFLYVSVNNFLGKKLTLLVLFVEINNYHVCMIFAHPKLDGFFCVNSFKEKLL
jgi:hypothetical protein